MVLPKVTLARESLDRLTGLSPLWVIAALLLEAASLVSYSLFSRVLVGAGKVRFSWILRADLAGYGVSHVVPGGAATATALRFRLLTSSGVQPTDVTATITAEAIGSPLALVLIAWLSSIAALFLRAATPAYLAILLIGLLAIACGFLAVRERSALERYAARLLRAGRLRDLLADRQVRRAFLSWATLNWILDATVAGLC